MEIDEAKQVIYGMPYSDWKKKYQGAATEEQLAQWRAASCAGLVGPAKLSLPERFGMDDNAAGKCSGEAAAFRCVIAHVQKRNDATDQVMMRVAAFDRPSLARWYQANLNAQGIDATFDEVLVTVVGSNPSISPNAVAPSKDNFVSAHASGVAASSAEPCCDPAKKGKQWRVAVVTVSDRASTGMYIDGSGPALLNRLRDCHWANVLKEDTALIVPDDMAEISLAVRNIKESGDFGLILTTGGTGFAERDVTPEAVGPLIVKHASGIIHAMFANTDNYLRYLSRPVAGLTSEGVLVITLPGSPTAACEMFDAIAGLVPHVLQVRAGVTQTEINLRKY